MYVFHITILHEPAIRFNKMVVIMCSCLSILVKNHGKLKYAGDWHGTTTEQDAMLIRPAAIITVACPWRLVEE